MSENEDAEKFARDLDALLEGRGAPPRPGDPALETARRLLSADLSADSRVRGALRARLLAAGRPRPWPRALLFRRPALAAAVLLLVLAPALTRLARRAPPAYPRGAEGLPVLPGRFAPFPARAADAQAVFDVAEGRSVALDGGRGVEWRLGGSSFRLESRIITIDDIIEKPKPGGVL